MLKACAGAESRGGTGTSTNSGADQEREKLQSPTETEDERNGRTPGDKGHERREQHVSGTERATVGAELRQHAAAPSRGETRGGTT